MDKTKGIPCSNMREFDAIMFDVPKRVTLKRTFNQPIPGGDVIKFWRVIGPNGHPNLNSDLSIEGMKEWGIIL